MASPVVESTSQNASSSSAATLVVTAPTGITENDYLVAWVGWYEIGSKVVLSTPGGWTALYNRGDEFEGAALLVKKATVADESAANYTFTWDDAIDYRAAGILRISGAALDSEEGGFEVDEELAPSGASPSYTTALTPEVNETLFVSCFFGLDTDIGSVQTIGTYASTPSLTFTERIDTGAQSGGASGNGITIGVATAPVSGTSTITSRSAVFSSNMTDYRSGLGLLINAPQSVTTDISHLAVTPDIDGVTASVNIAADVDHTETNAEPHGINTIATAPTQWTNETKPSTTWTNEQK